MTVRGVRTPARVGGVAAGLLGLVAAVVLAACSNHSGLRRRHPSDSEVTASAASGASVPLPSGLAAGSFTAGSPTASRKHSSSPPASPTSAAPASSAAASHGTSRHSGASSPAHRPPHSSTPAPPRSSVPPSPSVAVSPGRGLHGGEQVTVSGAYFAAGERVGVEQCRSGLSACVGLTARSATADGGGAFRTSFIVSSTVQLSSCHTDGCVIRVRRSDGDAFVVPISFG